MDVSNKIRYRVITQNRCNELIIENIEDKTHFISLAKEIFQNKSLLEGFSSKHAALIGYIVGSEKHNNKINQ